LDTLDKVDPNIIDAAIKIFINYIEKNNWYNYFHYFRNKDINLKK
jgi:hypothetical protein